MDLRDLGCGHPNYLSFFLLTLPLLLILPFSSSSPSPHLPPSPHPPPSPQPPTMDLIYDLSCYFSLHSSYILFPQSLSFYNLHLVHDPTVWNADLINSTTNAASLFSSVFLIVMSSPSSCIIISYAECCKYPFKCILLKMISTYIFLLRSLLKMLNLTTYLFQLYMVLAKMVHMFKCTAHCILHY